jgi:hypothetical protein
MAVDQVLGQPWTRKHDEPGVPVRPVTSRIVFPKSLEELIELCTTRAPGERLRAAGSHWALSDAAIADTTFVETHQHDELFQAMGRTLFEVVPGCLTQETIHHLAARNPPPYDATRADEDGGFYLVHFETGKRVYQLYAELDQGDDNNPDSLAVLLRDHFQNPDYLGPWAFRTLGGAGGQTVFGALNTGTHGGDFRAPPIADSVMAMHLVADGGRHYWIERESRGPLEAQLTDDDKLMAVYGDDRFKGREATGRDNFKIIRNDDVFDAVVVSIGRFGLVYSVVMRAVRQYTLHEERRLTTWQAVRGMINDPTSALYRIEPPQPPFSSKFLQVAVCLTPHDNFTKNLAGVTKRWNVPLAADPMTGLPSGRAERVGMMVDPFDAVIQAPRFEMAGKSHPYSPDPAHPGSASAPSFLERACTNARFMDGVIQTVIEEVENFIASNGAEIGAGLAAITAAGGGAALLALIPALIILLAILAIFAALLSSQSDPRLGQTLNDLKDSLLDRSDPDERAAGLLIWQMIAFQLFSSQQGNHDYEAISYAVMDGHDYFDQSCNVNVDSIEVFFDATDPMLIAFVDALTTFEIGQETMAKAFVGYASLRFTGRSRALIGEQRHPLTAVVEVAGLKDVTGTKELIDFATTLALDPNFNATLHWGQRNESMRSHVQRRFGDRPGNPTGDLHKWRAALSRLTRNGKLDGFSSAFTRRLGLEVVTPRITSLQVGGAGAFAVGQPFTVAWDCDANPPATTVRLRVASPSGVQLSFSGLAHAGQQDVTAFEPGVYTATLTASLNLNGELRQAMESVQVNV